MYESRIESTFIFLKSHDNFENFAFENQAVTFEKPIYFGFRVIDFPKVLM